MSSFQSASSEKVKSQWMGKIIAILIIFFLNINIVGLIIILITGTEDSPKYVDLPIAQQIIINWVLILFFYLIDGILVFYEFYTQALPLQNPKEWLSDYNTQQVFKPAKFVQGVGPFQKTFELTTKKFSLQLMTEITSNEKKVIIIGFFLMLLGSYPLLKLQNPFSYDSIVNVYNPLLTVVFGLLFMLLIHYFLFKFPSKKDIKWGFTKESNEMIFCSIVNPYEKKVETLLDKSFFQELRIQEQNKNESVQEIQKKSSKDQKMTFALCMFLSILLTNNETAKNHFILFIGDKKEDLELLQSIFTIWLFVQESKNEFILSNKN